MNRSSQSHKVMAVASLGGHWKQLLRITAPLRPDYDIVYVTTHAGAASMLPEGARLYTVADFSRWDAWRLPAVLWSLWRIIGREHPRAIVTTGAAPGLMAIVAGRMRGVRTIWIDSIANAATLSGSGKMASKIAHRVFTQWPHLAQGKVEWHGNSFGTEEGAAQ